MAITRAKLNFYASYSKTLNQYFFPLDPENISPILIQNDQEHLIKYFKHFHVES